MTKFNVSWVWRCAVFTVVDFAFICTLIDGATLSDLIANDRELSEFDTLLGRSEMGKTLLKHMSVTVFAPTNSAFQRYRGSHQNSADLLHYHIVKSSITSANFPAYLPSELIGGLPIWVKRNYDQKHVGETKFDYYANNARILKKDITGNSVEGFEQVLHIIDEVLEPIMPIPDDPTFRNPSAHRLVTNPAIYGINYEFSEIVRQMQMFQKEMVIQGGDGHTFFIPINSDNMAIWNKVDGKVIDAHIIPNQVFFTRSFPKQPQESMAYSEMLKTSLWLTNETSYDQRTFQLQVMSKTAVGYADYTKGVVVAKVIKANIPVKNGVVHIIENPLVVNNMNVFQLLEQNTNLEELSRLLNKYTPDILDELKVSSSVSLFAPSNQAFKNINKDSYEQILSADEKIRQMLRLHLVPQAINSENIARDQAISVPSRDRGRKLHISHSSGDITVLGGGVNATVTVADIGGINGYLHIIDKILGIPYHTIYEKLRSDAGLSETFRLGNQRSFNNQFTDLTKKFTYFVPHNEAWDNLKRQYRSEYEKLFSTEYSYHAIKILERHLVVNQRFTMDQLLNMKSVQMMHGTFEIKKMGGKYYVHWEGETAEIMDPDVEITNGVVHVIRSVLFKRRDLTNEAATMQVQFASFLTILLSTALVKFIV